MALTSAERGRRYHEAHPGRVAENTRRWRAAHPERVASAPEYMRAWRAAHPERLAEYSRRYAAAHPAERRATYLKRTYDLTSAEYDAMLEAQGGLCAICRQPETRVDNRTHAVALLSVDHNHATSVVRGLLCHRCNVSIGAFGDDGELLAAAAAYLKEHA